MTNLTAGQAATGEKETVAEGGKGAQTRAAILERAVDLASVEGLEGLTIGRLAAELEMSKSGLFAHFGSKQELQLATIEAAAERFRAAVIEPAMSAPDGAPRLRAMGERYLDHLDLYTGGCFWGATSAEYDDRPGPVRDALATMVQTWQDALTRSIKLAIDEGHLSPDTSPEQVMFEIHGLILALHHDARFLRNPGSVERARQGFERVLAHSIQPSSDAASAATLPPRPKETRTARR